MNSKVKCILIVATVFFISLTGCRTFEKNLGIVQMQNHRPVENNIFSSSFPEMKLQITDDFKYLGSVQLVKDTEERLSYHSDPGDKLTEVTSYLFGRMDQDNRIEEGVIIRVLVMQGDPSQEVPEIFSMQNKDTLESGKMKILEDIYQYDLFPESAIFAEKERGLISGAIPSCFLAKQLSIKAGLGNKSRVQILYFEDASKICESEPCGTCLDSRNRTEKQSRFLRSFADRSFAAIRFLKTKNFEDTTSRYVDTAPSAEVPAVQAPPAVEAPISVQQPSVVSEPPAATDSATPLEKRLEALKRVYEKNLISKEDYEKKKAEILEAL